MSSTKDESEGFWFEGRNLQGSGPKACSFTLPVGVHINPEYSQKMYVDNMPSYGRPAPIITNIPPQPGNIVVSKDTGILQEILQVIKTTKDLRCVEYFIKGLLKGG